MAECQIRVFKNIPVILKENSSPKLKLGKLSEDINIVNIRVNILEKKLKDNKINVEKETKDKNNKLNHIKKLILKTNNANDRIHNNEEKIKDIEKSVQWNAESEDINVNIRKRLEVIENISKDNAASLLIIQKERKANSTSNINVNRETNTKATLNHSNNSDKITTEPSKSTHQPMLSPTTDKRNLVIWGDSILKYMDVHKLIPNSNLSAKQMY